VEARAVKQVVLLGVIVVAIGGWWVYRVSTAEDYDIKPVTRKPSDFLATWRCLECGYEWTDRVARGPHKCPKCDVDAGYVHIAQGCSQCGTFVVGYQYDDELNPIEFKYKDGDWQPFTNEMGEWQLVCPTCGGPVMPAEAPRLAEPETPPDAGG